MITVPMITAFFFGILRLMAMGLAFYVYEAAKPGDMMSLGFAGSLALFAMTGQAVDVFKVARQLTMAQTTTSVTLQQPADSPAPVQLVSETKPAPTATTEKETTQ